MLHEKEPKQRGRKKIVISFLRDQWMRYLTENGAIQAANTRGNDALLPSYVIDLQAVP